MGLTECKSGWFSVFWLMIRVSWCRAHFLSSLSNDRPQRGHMIQSSKRKEEEEEKEKSIFFTTQAGIRLKKTKEK